ncbi:MAG: bacteriohemerythrin [Bacteroidales bacterium]|nr:bacteriohemerythrin [Bacteroidales bacterium]
MGKEFIIWNDLYKLGIEIIDAQHKKLVDLINKLHDAFTEGKAHNITNEIIEEMLNYADYHFQMEEVIFDKHNYPQSDQHKILHNDFFEKANVYKARVAKGEENVHYDLLKYLKEWLTGHIQGEDVKYVDYFKEKGIKIS